jgi:hypothetical protein
MSVRDGQRFMREAIRVAMKMGLNLRSFRAASLGSRILAARRNNVAEHHDAVTDAEIDALSRHAELRGGAGWVRCIDLSR